MQLSGTDAEAVLMRNTQSTELNDPSPEQVVSLLLHLTDVAAFDTREGVENSLGSGDLRVVQIFPASGGSRLDEELCILSVDMGGKNLITVQLKKTTTVWKLKASEFIFPSPGGVAQKISLEKHSNSDVETFEDLLTHFTPYTTRLSLRNTLAIVDARGEVSEIFAGDIGLQDEVGNGLDEKGDVVVDLDEEDFTTKPSKITVKPLDKATAEKNSSYLVTGSEYLAKGIVSSASLLAKGINMTSDYATNNLTPSRTPLILSEQAKRSIDTARTVSDHIAHGAAKVFDTAVNGIITAGKTVGSAVVPASIIPSSSDQPGRFDGVIKFGENAISAVGNIIVGVEEGAAVIGESLLSGISSAVTKKYGPDASHLFLATTAIGVDAAKTLVYFDSRGISRRVFVRKAGVVALQRIMKDQNNADLDEDKNKNKEGIQKNEVLFEAPDDKMPTDGTADTNAEKPDMKQ